MEKSPVVAKTVLYTGRVQGVGFRWTVKRLADAASVTGWVRNNRDGSVSMKVQGDETALSLLMENIRSAFDRNIVAEKVEQSHPDHVSGFAVVHGASGTVE